jgi:hypothetical protein
MRMEAARSQTGVGASRADIRREDTPARTVDGSNAGSRDVTLGLGVLGLCALAAIVLGMLSSVI